MVRENVFFIRNNPVTNETIEHILGGNQGLPNSNTTQLDFDREQAVVHK